MLRLILLVLPIAVAWFVSPTGVPMSLSKITAGAAGVMDWVKIGGLVALGIFFCMIPGKSD
jgi:hypothetical protein